MDIKWMKTFIVAAKYENFRMASEDLFLTQPAVTKHIKRLEDKLHAQLFERDGRKVVLTPAGHHFLPYALGILKEYEQALSNFESWKQGYNRKLLIATAPQIASSILPPILRAFMDDNPQIEVLVNVLKSYEIGEEISTGRADLGLTRIKPIETNIKPQIIHEDPVILIGPNVDGKGHRYDEASYLMKYRLITHNHPDYWDNLLNEIQRHYPTIQTMRVNQIEVTKNFIEQGLGVSYLPRTMVQDELKMKRLVEIKSDKVDLPKSLTYVLTKVETSEVSMFTRYLTENI